MDTPVIKAEYEGFKARMEDEESRQNRRLEILEENVRQINDLTVCVKEMAVNMGNMLKELEKQGERLGKQENRDGEMWRKAAGHVVTAVISIVLGFIFAKLGM